MVFSNVASDTPLLHCHYTALLTGPDTSSAHACFGILTCCGTLPARFSEDLGMAMMLTLQCATFNYIICSRLLVCNRYTHCALPHCLLQLPLLGCVQPRLLHCNTLCSCHLYGNWYSNPTRMGQSPKVRPDCNSSSTLLFSTYRGIGDIVKIQASRSVQ